MIYAGFLFLFGAGGYGIIEILYRGFTHWTMLLAGGVTLVFLQKVNQRFFGLPLFLRCGIGAGGITAIEFLFGMVFNHGLGLSVWDYSAEWGNLLGQVCPRFTAMWFLLCIPVFGLLHILQRAYTTLLAQRQRRSGQQAAQHLPATAPLHTIEIPLIPPQAPNRTT